MSRKIRVGVVFGGVSSEHEVSLASARSVLNAIDRQRFEVIEIGVTKDGHWAVGEGALPYLVSLAVQSSLPVGMDQVLSETTEKLVAQRGGDFPALPKNNDERRRFVREVLSKSLSVSDSRLPSTTGTRLSDLDVIFPLIHGSTGEDGAIQGLCRLLNIAVVGSDVLGSSVCMDKVMTNQVLDANLIPRAKWFAVLKHSVAEDLPYYLQSISEKLGGFPVFVKPSNAGSSIGISKVKSADELLPALHEAGKYDRRLIIEQAIKGRELEIGVLGRYDLLVSPVVSEIIPTREFYDYEAKYLGDSTKIELPARVPAHVVEGMKEYAKRAFLALDCCGMARVDFFWDEVADKLYFNEINTIPGFTQISQYPELMKTAGITYAALIEKLIEIALERQQELVDCRVLTTG